MGSVQNQKVNSTAPSVNFNRGTTPGNPINNNNNNNNNKMNSGRTPSGASITPGGGAGGSSYAESYARQEAFFKQVMKQREDTFNKLEKALSQTGKEIALCQDKNAQLSERLKDLDKMIEDERRKWRDRIEAEKKRLSAIPSHQY